MKSYLLIILFSLFAQMSFCQTSDFIVLKKRNNRTLKTYFPGAFISAVTHNDFQINGYIKFIRNDSIIFQQQETRLTPTELGSTLDTFNYTIGLDFREIKKFNYTSQYTWGRKKGFSQITLPRLMMIAGTGFVLLELINTGYRNDSLNDSKKLLSLGIGATVAVAGYIINRLQNQNDKAGKKYKVVYVRNTK